MYSDEPLVLMPGIFTDASDHASKGRWIDGSNVRFFKGYPERIGGWEAITEDTLSAPARGMHAFANLSGSSRYAAFGTANGLFLLENGTLVDISPVGENGYTTLIITVTGVSGTFQADEDVSASGGGTATIVEVVDASTINVSNHSGTFTGTLTGATSAATATITGTSSGGRVDGTDVTSWSEGTWGGGSWGGASTIYSAVLNPTTWTMASWGEDLLSCPRGGKIYIWDNSVGSGTPSSLISANAPSTALGIFMSDVNRTLVAYGAHDGSNDDPLNIAWCDTEDYTTWTPSATNAAGSIRCEVGSEIVGAIPVRGGHIISTDKAVYLFRYVGQPFVFSLNKIADGNAMIAPHAGINHLGAGYYMGSDGFYVYDGTVRRLPCDVLSYVYDDLNLAQKFKIFAGTVRKYNEVWWFYASSGSSEVDRYVAFNVAENVWHKGTLARTSWLDTSVLSNFPIATDADGVIYAQEYGTTGNGSSISYTLTSSDIDLATSGRFIHNRKLIPDYDRITGTHSVSIEVRGYPMRAATTKGPFTITEATDNISVRSRGRHVRLVFSGSDDFRMGVWKERITQHGARP